MEAIKKTKRIAPAIGVAIVAFFELCFTGRAESAWRMARADGKCLSKTAGMNGTPAEHPQSLPRHHKRSGAGFVNHSSPPCPAPIFILRLFVTAAIAGIVIAAALCVARPDGQVRQLEDGVIYGASIEASAKAREGQSSKIKRNEKIVMIGCLLVSVTLVAASIAIRKESLHGKKGKRKGIRRSD